MPPLHFSLLKGSSNEINKLLLHYGSNPNIRLKGDFRPGAKGFLFYKGYNAAHIAVRMNRSWETLKLLFEYNTNFKNADENGWTPFDLAIKVENHVAQNFIEEEVCGGRKIPQQDEEAKIVEPLGPPLEHVEQIFPERSCIAKCRNVMATLVGFIAMACLWAMEVEEICKSFF